MNHPGHNYQLLQLMLKAQAVARREGDRREGGYAMVIASVLTIFIFALLTAYLNISNISKSATNAYVDGTNAFYAAESALNKRAYAIRKKFDGYSLPEGTSPGTANADSITNCFSKPVNAAPTNDDFECRNFSFTSASSGLHFNSTGGKLETGDKSNNTDYVAFTFVADRTNYDTTTNPRSPFPVRIPAGQTYAGMNAQEYRYTIFAYAAKPDGSNGNPVNPGDAKTVLKMDFKSRIIPLFQFGAFYDGDLEINPSAPMTINGWVQTNANLYIEPTPYTSDPAGDLVFLGNVSAGGDIYNRVDAASFHRTGVTMVQMPSSRLQLSTTGAANLFAYNPNLIAFNGKVTNGSNGGNVLKIPDAGLLRKRNYLSKAIGSYFAKADMRVEAVPGRAIPFDFVSIQNGAGATGGTCVNAKPTGDNDPDPLYIDAERQGTDFKCSKLSKGQLISLQQPVLVLTRGNTTEETRFCKAAPAGEIDRLRNIIDYANVTADPTMAGLTTAQQDKVLRALSLAISATRTVLDYGYMNKWNIHADVPSVMNTFGALLTNDSSFNPTDKTIVINSLKAAKPAEIAKARQSCFLPAPIQLIGNIPDPPTPGGGGGGGGGGTTPPSSPENPAGYFRRIDASKQQKATRRFLAYVAGSNPGNFGNNTFGGPNAYVPVPWAIYDRREQRWMSTIQINIESMAIWNRDGRFVKFDSNPNLNSATDTPTPQELTDALNGGNPTSATAPDSYSGNGLLFTRAAASGSGSKLINLGLAAADRTDNGLVFHATVNDDAGGVAPNTSNPIVKGSTTVDYYRTEFGGDIQKSMYAFAIAGGKELPAPMTIASDRAIYLQGNYNLSSYNKQPAAIMGDTISVLSVNCLSPGGSSLYSDPRGQRTANINCVYPDDIYVQGKPSPWTGANISMGSGSMSQADDTTYNTAFLSFTIASYGNQGDSRGYGTANPRYSGGLNNYVRLLEDWRTKNLNYTGSMVSLGEPLESNGFFIPAGLSNSYFGIPNRNFSYDTSFDSYLGLPPLTPKAVYLQQEVFKRG